MLTEQELEDIKRLKVDTKEYSPVVNHQLDHKNMIGMSLSEVFTLVLPLLDEGAKLSEIRLHDRAIYDSSIKQYHTVVVLYYYRDLPEYTIKRNLKKALAAEKVAKNKALQTQQEKEAEEKKLLQILKEKYEPET